MSPEFSRAAEQITATGVSETNTPVPAGSAAAKAPDLSDEASIEKPDFSVRVTRPNAPKDKTDIPFRADDQVEDDHGVSHLKGNVVFEFPNATLKADTVDYDSKSGLATAAGNVYYRDYDHDEVMYCGFRYL